MGGCRSHRTARNREQRQVGQRTEGFLSTATLLCSCCSTRVVHGDQAHCLLAVGYEEGRQAFCHIPTAKILKTDAFQGFYFAKLVSSNVIHPKEMSSPFSSSQDLSLPLSDCYVTSYFPISSEQSPMFSISGKGPPCILIHIQSSPSASLEMNKLMT